MVHPRDEWDRIRARGLRRFVVIGALRRGIPMAIGVVLLLEILQGNTLTRERLTSPEFAERVLVCLLVFVAGGALSAFARWKSHEALFGDRDEA